MLTIFKSSVNLTKNTNSVDYLQQKGKIVHIYVLNNNKRNIAITFKALTAN